MNDILASKLSLMGVDRLISLEELSVVFFKMTVADKTGLVVAANDDMASANMTLFKKMTLAFKAELQNCSNPQFDCDYMWLLGASVANHLSGKSHEINEWINGEHSSDGMKVFVYPTLTEIANNSSYKSFVWRSFSEYIKVAV